MTSLVVHEDSESLSGSKVGKLVTEQIQDVLEVDTSAIDPHKLKRKIDFRLLPWLTLLYLMNFLDRSSIGNARVCTLCIPTILVLPYGFLSPIAV